MVAIKKIYTYTQKLIQVLGLPQAILFVFYRIFGKKLVKLKISSLPEPLYCRPTKTDIHVLWQVFCSQDKDFINTISSPKLIVDAGSHIGYFSLFCLNQYPGVRIIGIEPDLSNLEIAKKNCKSYSNINLIHGAIWKNNNSVIIENPEDESWSFRVKENPKLIDDIINNNEISQESIPSYTISRVIKEFNLTEIDLIKFDIEGAEKEVFIDSDSELDWLDKCKALLIEVHDQTTSLQIQDKMRGANFKIKQLGEKLFCYR